MNYRVTVFPAIEVTFEAITMEFETEKEMLAAEQAMADLVLFLQDTVELMDDYSNVFTMERFVDGEWEDYKGD